MKHGDSVSIKIIIINLICMFTIGYFSWHLGLAQGKSACIQNYFGTIQAEEKFLIETVNLIQCESNNKHYNVWGDDGKAYGRFQFWKPTFYNFVKEAGMEDMVMDWQNPEHQYRVYRWAYSNGKLKHWTCYKEVRF